jgi:hypothetical protein
MALAQWLGPQKRSSGLTSIKLDARGYWPERLVGFSSHGWHSFTREGAPTAKWAQSYHAIVRPRYMDVKLNYATGLAQAMIVKPRAQYRKAQPAKKTYALAAALRQSAEAIRSKRG